MIEITTDSHKNFGDNRKIWVNVDNISILTKLDTGETFLSIDGAGVILCKETVEDVREKMILSRLSRATK